MLFWCNLGILIFHFLYLTQKMTTHDGGSMFFNNREVTVWSSGYEFSLFQVWILVKQNCIWNPKTNIEWLRQSILCYVSKFSLITIANCWTVWTISSQIQEKTWKLEILFYAHVNSSKVASIELVWLNWVQTNENIQ